MSDSDAIQATLNFAIGMERVFKGILYSVNLTYVLVLPEFNHSLRILYPEKILDSPDRKSILEKSPIGDVITFRNSLLRACEISDASQKNKSRLFGLSHMRDVVVHNDLEVLDLVKVRTLLQRDFYFISMDFIEELKLPRTDWFGSLEANLIQVSRPHQQDIVKIIRLKLEGHRRAWESTKNEIGAVQRAGRVTDELLESTHRHETICPACGQRAILFSEPDYIIDTNSAVKTIVGEFVRLMKCEFCGLHVDDDTELDEMGFGKNLNSTLEDDIPF